MVTSSESMIVRRKKKVKAVFRRIILLILPAGMSVLAQAQHAMVFGTVTDNKGKPIFGVNVAVIGSSTGTVTDSNGKYTLEIKANEAITLGFSFIGYNIQQLVVRLNENEKRELNRMMEQGSQILPAVEISDTRSRVTGVTRINPKTIQQLPTVSGSFEDVLKTMPGVVTNNELSSQYNVRGGSFDENLVYVNDFEIYRPFLVRSGQQEGLSFINSDMVSNVLFSAGGFEANYGDKMSSVLDVKYRKPTQFGGSANASLLGGSLQLEGISKNKKLNFLSGIRYKSNQYLLKSLETKGEYKPSFLDFQATINYAITQKTELNFLGNLSRNKFRVVPSSRQTDFGTINQALRLSIYFDGQEVDSYGTMMGGLSITHYADEHLKLKFLTSAFYTDERETFDILGQYYLDELERDLGSSEFGETAFNRGVGSLLDHARNSLNAKVINGEHRGWYHTEQSDFSWGIRFQAEHFKDQLNEWKYIDSAGYSLPHPQNLPGINGPYNQQIILQDVLKSQIELSTYRISGFVQYEKAFGEEKTYWLNAGWRLHYYGLNNESVTGPRVIFSWKPAWRKNLLFRVSSGYYYQPPFFRELRNIDGLLNREVKSQRSIHIVAGNDYQFLAFGREFKLVSEFYYKKLDHLVPYKIENLRIRYLSDQTSKGYAAGADFRINGEFVPGTESWISVSLLQTKEDITGDYYYNYYNSDGEKIIPGYTYNSKAIDSIRIEPGYLPRPTDQRLTFSMFFQDYIPRFPTWKVHLSLIYGTGLPFGPPGRNRYNDVLRIPDYRRVDIGFSKILIDEENPRVSRLKWVNKLKACWVSLEVFNLLQVSNAVSYLWVADITNRYYAVPNYLSARTINLRLGVKF